MKKIIILVLLTAVCTVGKSQNHFKNTWYMDAAVGLSDQVALEPSLGVGYNINNWFSVNGRYAFKTPYSADKYRFFEHSLDIFAKCTVVNYKELICLNLLGGFTQSYNKYSEIPRPTFNPKVINFGYIGGIEIEYLCNNNLAFFAQANNRGYFLDKKHLELTYQIGARMDLSLFTLQTIRRK